MSEQTVNDTPELPVDTPERPNEAPEPPARTPEGQFRPRITAQNRTAIEYMVYQGESMEDAAQRAELKPATLRKNLRKPHIAKFYAQCLENLRKNGPARAYIKITTLMDQARGERVQFDAARWVAGVDGLSPVTKVEGKHQHTHSFEGYDYGDEPIDVTPDED